MERFNHPALFLIVVTVAVVAMAHGLAYVTGKVGLTTASKFFAFNNG